MEQCGVVEQGLQRGSQRVDVARFEQQSIQFVLNEVRESADARRNHRHTGHERFVHDERRVLEPDGRHHQDVERVVHLVRP